MIANLRKMFIEAQQYFASDAAGAIRAEDLYPESDRLIPRTGAWLDESGVQEVARGHESNALAAAVSQVIVFDAEQVNVFWDLIKNRNFVPSIEYRLPFENVWIQFSRPVSLSTLSDKVAVEHGLGRLFESPALLLSQSHITQDDVLRAVHRQSHRLNTPIDDAVSFVNEDWENRSSGVLNTVRVIDREMDCQIIHWEDIDPDNMYLSENCSPEHEPDAMRFRLLAAACIQYINCENIYLEKQGEVPEAVNRKREAKGKSRLEPYYVCRIKGVQYDGHATGEGSKRGIRYDVRGHFRRLETGKTIWVRPHQRGLTNELYIPKVYKVNKGAKPAGDVGRTGTKV